jgi:hypothetical protein
MWKRRLIVWRGTFRHDVRARTQPDFPGLLWQRNSRAGDRAVQCEILGEDEGPRDLHAPSRCRDALIQRGRVGDAAAGRYGDRCEGVCRVGVALVVGRGEVGQGQQSRHSRPSRYAHRSAPREPISSRSRSQRCRSARNPSTECHRPHGSHPPRARHPRGGTAPLSNRRSTSGTPGSGGMLTIPRRSRIVR